MSAATISDERRSGGWLRVGKAPIPHEHGAWVILYAPLVVGFAAASSFSLFPAFLLTVAVTGAYLARNAAAILIRKRGKEGTAFWLAVYTALFLGGAAPLVFGYDRVALWTIGAAILALFGIHAVLTIWPSRKRLDRSVAGELLAVGALSMTGPAAYAVETGALDSKAWLLWAANALFYAGGIVHVKMFFRAIRVKGEFHAKDRLRAGRENLVYHGALMLLVGWIVVEMGGLPGILLWFAYVPAILRAFQAVATLTNNLPPLKLVGIFETVYALWFTALLIAAIRLA